MSLICLKNIDMLVDRLYELDLLEKHNVSEFIRLTFGNEDRAMRKLSRYMRRCSNIKSLKTSIRNRQIRIELPPKS